jgi:fermentation-respiration switch protein FrsA (DUF1100 family)
MRPFQWGIGFHYRRSVRRQDLTFQSGGITCQAWLYRPATDPRAPCVILAHGFDGVREQRLDAYASRFCEAGLAALVFDYRHFGASGGSPRQLFDNSAQLADWRAAIECARHHEHLDPERIALWGTSTSAGHVIELAAEDRRVATVVVQMPLVDGLAQLAGTPFLQSIRLLWAGLRDRLRGVLGLAPLTIPAAGQPGTLAAVTSPDALSGLARITPRESTWDNEVLARFTLTTALYRPGRLAAHVHCPLLVCLADGDLVIPAKPALKMVDAAARAELRRYPFGHFAMYYGDGFARASRDQADFLRTHLGVKREQSSRFAPKRRAIEGVR